MPMLWIQSRGGLQYSNYPKTYLGQHSNSKHSQGFNILQRVWILQSLNTTWFNKRNFQSKPLKFNLQRFYDLDYVGDRVERKSTSGRCHFIKGNLVSWTSKKQAMISFSIAKAKYVSATLFCTQLLWIKNYDVHEAMIPIICDNNVAIILSKNPILHSRAKHMEIKHHFIRDYVLKGIVDMQFISTD